MKTIKWVVALIVTFVILYYAFMWWMVFTSPRM